MKKKQALKAEIDKIWVTLNDHEIRLRRLEYMVAQHLKDGAALLKNVGGEEDE